MQVRAKAMKLSVTWRFPKSAPQKILRTARDDTTLIFNWEIWPGLLSLRFQNLQHWYKKKKNACAFASDHPNNSPHFFHSPLKHQVHFCKFSVMQLCKLAASLLSWSLLQSTELPLVVSSFTVYFTVPVATCICFHRASETEICRSTSNKVGNILYHFTKHILVQSY